MRKSNQVESKHFYETCQNLSVLLSDTSNGIHQTHYTGIPVFWRTRENTIRDPETYFLTPVPTPSPTNTQNKLRFVLKKKYVQEIYPNKAIILILNFESESNLVITRPLPVPGNTPSEAPRFLQTTGIVKDDVKLTLIDQTSQAQTVITNFNLTLSGPEIILNMPITQDWEAFRMQVELMNPSQISDGSGKNVDENTKI